MITKESFVTKRAFTHEVLAGFGISQVVLEKKKLLVYVEEGNNSRMVKEMLRKRPHLKFVNDKKQANLVWTRFCDYESSKLTSKFSQEKSTISTLHNEDDNEIDSRETISLLHRQIGDEAQRERIIFQDLKYHNHLTNHYEISDKKSLFSNLQKYCVKNKINIF